MAKCRITSIEFKNYKAFANFSVQLKGLNVLVGPNNAGKSTVLGALRILSVGLRRARAKSAELMEIGNSLVYGHYLSRESLPVSLENVHTDLAETDTTITFRLSNGNHLVLAFPLSGGCVLHGETNGRPASSPSLFKSAFPVSVGVVPVLGPVEHEEQLVGTDTVQRNIGTHRASRNFRSFWYHNPDGFEDFAAQIRRTWPGMDVQPPECEVGNPPSVRMFCTESRMTREIYWAGFGFQVWCQVLTHLRHASDAGLVVVDEPEIYLHADLQRRLRACPKTLTTC